MPWSNTRAIYRSSLANHYKNGKILWALSNCWLQPIFSEFRPENMGVIWAARSCFHVYWKSKSIVFVGSCHQQLQSCRKLSFGLQEDLKIYLFVLDPKVERGWSITSLWICRSSDAYFEAYHILDEICFTEFSITVILISWCHGQVPNCWNHDRPLKMSQHLPARLLEDPWWYGWFCAPAFDTCSTSVILLDNIYFLEM